MIEPMFRNGFNKLLWKCLAALPPVALKACFWFRRAIDPLREPTLALTRFESSDAHVGAQAMVLGGGLTAEHFATTFCGETADRRALKSVPLIAAGKRLRALAQEADLVIARLPRALNRALLPGDFLCLPQTVQACVHTPLDPQTIKYIKRSQRENLRRIRKNNLFFQISQDISDLKEFYYQHYIPHSQKRFAGGAALVNIHRLEYYLRRGALIFWIVQAGHRLAGGLVIPDGTVLRLAVQGIALGRDDYLRQGASSALYHLIIEWAAEQGFSYLDLGLASPSLSDRILATKRRWGACLEPEASDRYSYAIHWRTCDHKVLRLLHREQPIFRDGAHLSAMTALAPDQPHDYSAIEELARRCWMPGLHRLVVVADDPEDVVASHGARTSDAVLWITKPGPVVACISQAVPLDFTPPRAVDRTIAEGTRPASVESTVQRSNLPDCQTS
jgi:hypothetical protein